MNKKDGNLTEMLSCFNPTGVLCHTYYIIVGTTPKHPQTWVGMPLPKQHEERR